jgi:hypothetical protein
VRYSKEPCRRDHSFDLLTEDCGPACRAIASPAARATPHLTACGEAIVRAQQALERGDLQEAAVELKAALQLPGAWRQG